MRRNKQLSLLAMLALGPPAAAAQDLPGDPVAGRALAEALCSACHVVSREQRGPVPDSVPSFLALATDATRERILSVLVSPSHPAMPTPPLDRRQMQDVATYVLSLREP